MSSGTQPDTTAKPAVFPTMWNNKRAAFAFLAPAVAALEPDGRSVWLDV